MNKQDQHASSSNAASYLDLVAPGVDIQSTVPGNNVSTDSGTSMAAPHVTGTIALLKEADDTLTPSDIRTILQNTAETVPEMFGQPHTDEHGHGRLDAYASVLQALDQNPDYRIVDNNITWSDITITGETIFVLPGITLTIDGSVTLDESELVVLGTLAGSSSAILYLQNSEEPIFRASGVDAFNGSIIELVTEYVSHTFSSNTTISVAPHTVNIYGTTTIEASVTLDLSSDVVLSGTVNGSNGSRIRSYGNLTIQPGTELNNVQIVSQNDGYVHAVGTTLNPIIFDGEDVDRPGWANALLFALLGGEVNVQNSELKNSRHLISLYNSEGAIVKNNELSNFSNPAQSYGIYVNGSQGDILIEGNSIVGDNYQGHCISISNANTNVLVEENDVQKCNIGLRLYQTNASVIENTIEDNAFGLNAEQLSQPEYRGNKIRYNISRGVFLNAASPWLMYNVIAGNGGNQVLANESGANFADHPLMGDPEPGHNVIAYGGGPMVKVQNGSAVFFGYYSQGGYNSFYDTDLPHIRSEGSSSVWADLNYWDGGPGNSADGTSFVTNLYPLSTDPNPPYYQKSIPISTNKTTDNVIISEAESNPPTELMAAITLGMEGEYEESLAQLNEFIQLDRNSAFAPLALNSYYLLAQKQLHAIANDANRNALQANLTSYLNLQYNLSEEDSLVSYATRLLARDAMQLGKHEIAMGYYRDLELKSELDSTHKLIALYNLFVYHLEVLNDMDKASAYLNTMVENYPSNDLTLTARALVNLPPQNLLKSDQVLPSLETNSGKLSHLAYPNPFNPTTIINFNLPSDSQVQLSVYDTMGRRVSQIVNGRLGSGLHEIPFSGTNLASGIYMYRLVVNGNVETGKMMLLK